jgi:hypothetical protein
MRKQFFQFIAYVKKMAESTVFWLSLLVTFGDFLTNYIIPYFNLNIKFQILFNVLATLGILGLLWSGFRVYKEKQQKSFEPIKSIKLSFIDGNEYIFQIDDRVALSSDDYPSLPSLILTLHGKVENDGDIPVNVLNINADIDLRKKGLLVKKYEYDFSKIEKLKPFTITKFTTTLSGTHNKDYPILLYSGDKIHFYIKAEFLIQTYTNNQGFFADYNPAQVTTLVRGLILEKAGTNIDVWAEFDEIERVTKPEMVKRTKYIKFEQLCECLISYWDEYQMFELVELSRTTRKKSGRN